MTSSTLEYKDHSITCYQQGAHLSSWTFKGKEQLFLSKKAIFEPGVALRGGVPICFPQFGAFGPGKKHGFARNTDWQLYSKTANELAFKLEHEPDANVEYDFSFEALYTVSLSGSEINMQLSVTNTDKAPISFTSALHTYLRVEDVQKTHLLGLHNCEYWDNGTEFDTRNLQTDDTLSFSSAIDRVYFNTPQTLSLNEGPQTRLISSKGFNDVVVWNPWQEGAKQLQDLADEEYKNMLCIEAANVETPTNLAAGESWSGSQTISLVK